MAASLLGTNAARQNGFRAPCGIHPLQFGVSTGMWHFRWSGRIPVSCDMSRLGFIRRAGDRWILRMLGMNEGMSGYAKLTRPTG